MPRSSPIDSARRRPGAVSLPAESHPGHATDAPACRSAFSGRAVTSATSAPQGVGDSAGNSASRNGGVPSSVTYAPVIGNAAYNAPSRSECQCLLLVRQGTPARRWNQTYMSTRSCSSTGAARRSLSFVGDVSRPRCTAGSSITSASGRSWGTSPSATSTSACSVVPVTARASSRSHSARSDGRRLVERRLEGLTRCRPGEQLARCAIPPRVRVARRSAVRGLDRAGRSRSWSHVVCGVTQRLRLVDRQRQGNGRRCDALEAVDPDAVDPRAKRCERFRDLLGVRSEPVALAAPGSGVPAAAARTADPPPQPTAPPPSSRPPRRARRR